MEIRLSKIQDPVEVVVGWIGRLNMRCKKAREYEVNANPILKEEYQGTTTVKVVHRLIEVKPHGRGKSKITTN